MGLALTGRIGKPVWWPQGHTHVVGFLYLKCIENNMWLKILFVIIGIYVVFRIFTFLFGNWRATLNRVISQFIAWKQMQPEYSDEQLFMEVLDHRYPDGKGLFAMMHSRKDEIKISIKAEIESRMSIIDKYSLPILVFTCLLIEENSYLNSEKSVEELLEPIEIEIKKQGFEKYC